MSETSPVPIPIPTRDSVVILHPIKLENLREICNLSVLPSQKVQVSNNAFAIAQAHYETDPVWMRGVYADETPVGFIQLSEDPPKGEYYLWRIMIDARYQNLGFGSKIIQLVLEHVKKSVEENAPVPFKALWLGVANGEEQLVKFYESFGFKRGQWVENELKMIYQNPEMGGYTGDEPDFKW